MSEIRNNYHALVRSEVLPLVPTMGGTLLDVGGGIGATAAALKSCGKVDRVGIADLVEPSTNDLDVDFHYAGNLEEPEFLDNILEQEGPFSTILCLDVLEHIQDPWTLVKRLHSALTPNGVIIASIPNIRHYTASFPLFFCGRWTLEDAGIRDRTHLRWFVKETAIELMTSSGLRLEAVVPNPTEARRIRLIRKLTLGMFNSFTDLQYLIRVRNVSTDIK